MADEQVILYHPSLPESQVISARADVVDYYGASGWKPVPKSKLKAAAEVLNPEMKEQ